MLGIPAQQGVAGNDQIMVWNFCELPGAFGTLDGQHAQLWTERRCLAAPIPNQRGGADYEVRPGKRLHHRQRLNCFSKPHLVRKKPCRALAGIFQKPESPFHLIRPQAFAKRAERPRIEVGSGCGRMPRPIGNARFDVAALRFPEFVGTPFLRGIAVPEDFLQITRQFGVRHGQASIGEPQLGFSALQ